MKWLKSLYVQVIIAVAVGVAVGVFLPEFAVQCKPLIDIFIRLIKLFVAPIVFLSIVTGIAKNSIKNSGKISFIAIVYFEVITTIALLLGIFVINFIQPGKNMNLDIQNMDKGSVSQFIQHSASHQSFSEFVLQIIPETVFQPFLQSNLLQVLFLAIMIGIGLAAYPKTSVNAIIKMEKLLDFVFFLFNKIMKISPIAAFGAIAYTVGKFGANTLQPLLYLMVCFYLTCFLFVIIILQLVCNYCGTSIIKVLKLIKEEIILVLGTSSSESALPLLMKKLVANGISENKVKLILPLGYSFNLDGTSIYLTMAAIFIAQAFNIHLTIAEQMGLVAVMLLTSKGAAAVTGGGFITLAASLQVSGKIPVEGLALIIGIDRFMSEARAITNLIGNTVAVFFVDKVMSQSKD